MHVIAINSQKGGSGKTMLAKHLSVEAVRAGDGPVYLIDNDPQATLSLWFGRRDSEEPQLAEVPFTNLAAGLEQLERLGAKLVFIDTASGRVDIAREIFGLADFALFPIQDSQDDLDARAVTIEGIRAADVRFMFVLTRVKPNTLITAAAAATLSKHGQVAETFIRDRTGYKTPYEEGKTVTEAEPKGPAAKEIAALWKNIKTCLHDTMQDQPRKVAVHG
jgi:chromosome partitioning protein